MREYDSITLEILWSRLIAIVDESAATLRRAAFSTVVNESNDYACVLMDANGDSLAESTVGVPSFLGIMPKSTKYMMEYFPPSTLRPGDALMTNDPWLATGHIPDVCVVMPIFRKGRIVAWAANVAHSPDMGGVLWAADTRELFEEGLRIPPTRFMEAGRPNETLVNIIRSNVRTPDTTVGDMYAQLSAAEVCARRLLELMDELGADDLGDLSHAIQTRAEQVMRQAITEVPDGEYTSRIETDGYDSPTVINTRVTVRGDEIFVDFTGSSPQIDRALNSVLNYTIAYTQYPIKCALAPETPKNEGSNRPIHVSAPEGSILNATYPAPVNCRQLTSHFLAAAVYQALAPAIPHKVAADAGSGPGLRPVLSGIGYNDRRFTAILFAGGGMGATYRKDGLSCTQFPLNASAGSLEVHESVAPLLFWKREMLTDSGGPGKHRGGLSQEIVMEIVAGEPVRLSTHSDRRYHPALGLFGGLPGAPTNILRNDTESVHPKGRAVLQPHDRLALRYGGGGGYGPPDERDLDLIEWDLKNGLISDRAAEETYRLNVRKRGSRD